MNFVIILARKETLLLLKRVHMAMIAIVGILAAVWGSMFFWHTSKASGSESDIKAHMATISESRKTIEAAELLEAAPQHTGMQSVVALQTALQKNAATKGCEIAEFQATSEQVPYLSRFRKITDKNEWSQVEVHLTIVGSLNDVFSTLAGMKYMDVPFEFNSVDMTRGQVFSENAFVNAKVDLRVLTK